VGIGVAPFPDSGRNGPGAMARLVEERGFEALPPRAQARPVER
jgi:hypothetical protein